MTSGTAYIWQVEPHIKHIYDKCSGIYMTNGMAYTAYTCIWQVKWHIQHIYIYMTSVTANIYMTSITAYTAYIRKTENRLKQVGLGTNCTSSAENTWENAGIKQ